MPKLEYFEPVDAELQTIWTVLLDRIEHPTRYMVGVEAFEFLEGDETYAIRQVVIGGIELKEKITIDETQGEIRYQLLDHPLYTGDVYNALIPPAEDDPKAKPVVQFRMDWQPLNEEAQALDVQAKEMMQASLEDAVHFVREMAETMERQKREKQAAPQ